MKILLLKLALFILLFNSCSKGSSNNAGSYNYDVNITNPATLPLGSIVVDLNGVKTKFDSAASAHFSYSQINNATSYILAIVGFNYQSAQSYSSITVQLRGWMPKDTASFYSYQVGIETPGINSYVLGYNVWVNTEFNSYNFNNQTRLYKAQITHIDDSTVQGNFSGYLTPYNFTNGAFNLKR